MIPTPTLTDAALILVSIPGAMITHELAHWLAAGGMGCQPRLRAALTRSMAVTYERPERDVWEAWILLAPLWSGLVAAGVVLAVGGWPTPTYPTLAAVLWWLFHTVRESGDDVRAVVGELEDWREDALKALVLLAVAGAISVSPYGATGIVHWLIVIPCVMAAAALGGLSERDRLAEET